MTILKGQKFIIGTQKNNLILIANLVKYIIVDR